MSTSTKQPAPLHHLRPAVAAAALYAVAVVVWLAFGDALPGGRWFTVHLFTLGILTNLVVALSHHFTETLLHAASTGRTGVRLALLNAGILAMLAAMPAPGLRWVFAAGATAVLAAVAWLYVDLRRQRRQALTQRFAFVVRGYERACGAFVHGAMLGVLIGLGVLGGAWWGSARLAHLHLNILGWGGFVLLATVVFFGPTMMRTRIRQGADDRAARALRVGMTALTAGALLLLASGVGGTAGGLLRVGAAVAFAGYAAAATVVCLDVIRAGLGAKAGLATWAITAACSWFAAVVWVDVTMVALGAWRLLDALGAVLLAGVLGQAILAALTYLAPMMSRGGPDARASVRSKLEHRWRLRVVALNVAVALIAAGAVAGRGAGLAASVAVHTGWGVLAGVVLSQLMITGIAFLRAPSTASATT